MTIPLEIDIIKVYCALPKRRTYPVREDVKMKKKIKRIAAIVVAVLILAGVIGAYGWHRKQMKSLRTELTTEYEKEKRLEERIEKIRAESASLEQLNHSQSDQIQSQSLTIEELEQKADELAKKLDDLLTKEVAVFDAGAVLEEVRNISELATVEYRYTNVVTLDSSKTFSFIDWKVPFSDKVAIVTMDGVIKAGTDLSQVKINCNENKKLITVSLPKSKILSNELFEQSFKVYEEKDSVWNPITLDESNELRVQIKDKARLNAIANNVLNEATDRAKQLIQKLIEAAPDVKGHYKIEFRTES